MLRTKKKQLNLKPNRVLDKRSSRGMLFENEELRLRTIHINDEVEKGQSEVKKLRKENEYLKREIWSLRDECEKLEEVLKKIYNGSEIPDLSELPAYQPTTRKHSTASAFGMWSSRRLSGISTYSSYCDYEDDDDDKSQRDDDNTSRRHSTCNDSDNDHSTSGQYQNQDQQDHEQQQQQHYQQYYEGGGAPPPEEIVSVHVHYTEDGQQYMTEYDDEDDVDGMGPSQRQPKISIDSTNSLESGQLSMDLNMELEQHTETDLENHSPEEGVDIHTIRYYNQPLPLQPLHHHTWQLHSPELEAVTEESENNTVNTNSNNTSITITPHDQNNESFDTLENLDNPNGLNSSGRAVSVNGSGDKDKSNTISPFFNPTIEITPASSTSTNSNSNSSMTSGKKVMSENMSSGDNNSMASVNNGTVGGGGEVEESSNIISCNATSGVGSGSGFGMVKSVVTKSIEGTRAERDRDRDGNGLPIDLGCVTLIPKKYQVTSEIKINTTTTTTSPSDVDSSSASVSTSSTTATSVGQINTRTDPEVVVINGPSTKEEEQDEGEAGEHNSNHHHHPNMLQTQIGMKRKEEDGNLTDGENNLTSSWDPLPFRPIFEKTPSQNTSTSTKSNASGNVNNSTATTSINISSSRLEEKRRNFGLFYRNSQKTSSLTIGKENEISSDSESVNWTTGNHLDGENTKYPSNITNSVSVSADGVRKKSLPLYQSEPSLTSIIDSNQTISHLRVASENNNSCRCVHHTFGSGSCRRSISGELGFDGFDHTVEMCSLLSPVSPSEDEILQTQDNENNEQDPSECIPNIVPNSGFPAHGWNSVDRNVVIGYLDEEEGGKDVKGFEDLSAQEVIDELEMQFDPTLERVAGVRMLTNNVKIPRVFISLRTAVGVKTFIEKGFSLRSCPLKLMDASKKFALILLSGIPPSVQDTSVISILNEFGQVVAPLERRTYKGVDISERLARMHLVRKMPGGGTTTLSISGYPVLVKILQTNVSPGLSNPNTLSRPHSVNQQYSQQQQQQPLYLSPMKTQEMTSSNNSLIPPGETQPSPSRYQNPNVIIQNQRQGQVPPTSPRTAPVQPPSPGFIDFSRRPSTSIPVTPSSPGGLRPHSPSPQIPTIPISKIPSPHRKLGKSISAAPGYLPGNPDDQQQQSQSQIHSLGPTALAINKRKMSVCSIDPGDTPIAISSIPKTPTSPNTNPKAFLGNPKKPLARLSRNSLVPQSSVSGSGLNPNESSGEQPQQQSGSGLGMIKPLLRSLSFEPRRISSVSTHHHPNNNNNNNNNISSKGPAHGSQVSLAESQQYQPFQGQGSRGSILMHSNSGSGRSQPKYYQPHGQLTNNNSNSSNFRNMDKKSSESALPWFGCC